MDIKDLQNLIKFVSKAGVSEVKYKTKDFEIDIKTDSYTGGVSVMQQAPVYQQPVAQAPAATSAPAMPATTTNTAPAVDESNLVTIKSPMIGTFYRKPSPDKDNFVNVGSEVSNDTVVCVIEAMKLFNQIEAEVSGKIVKVLVEDASPVEYDQPLFLVDPS